MICPALPLDTAACSLEAVDSVSMQSLGISPPANH